MRQYVLQSVITGCMLLALFESEPLYAQSSSNNLSDKWLFGISAGVLTASAPQLVRHYLPPLIGITARKRLSSGSFFIADAYYSRWRETLSYSERYPQLSFVLGSDSTREQYPQYPEAIRMDSVHLSVGYETSIGFISGLPIQIGGKLGLRFFKEKWEYVWPRWLDRFGLFEIGEYVLPPTPVEQRRETQLTASLRIGFPLGKPDEGRGIYADYTLPHSLFQWTGGNAPSRSSDSGLRVVIVHSFNSVPSKNEKDSDELNDADNGRVCFMVGSAGLGRGLSRWHGESLFGLQMSWKLVTGLGLDAEVVTVGWKDGKARSRDTFQGLGDASELWIPGRMRADGRIWEVSIGPMYSPTRGPGPQVAIGIFAGIRRQEEHWKFNLEGWSNYPIGTPASSPGIQVEGLLGLKLLAALSSRPNAVRAQISLTRKRWQISPDEPNNAVETDGYRIAFLVPIDSF